MGRTPTEDEVLAALPAGAVTAIRILFETGARHAAVGYAPLKDDRDYVAGYTAAKQWLDAAVRSHLLAVAKDIG